MATRRAFVLGEEVRLTPREYDLLRTLARNAGRVVTHKQLIAAVWGPEASVDAQFVRVLLAPFGRAEQRRLLGVPGAKHDGTPRRPAGLVAEPGKGARLFQ